MATTYEELKTEIQRWLDNDNPNLVAAIPDFIRDAEVRFDRILRLREQECRTTTDLVLPETLDSQLGVYDLPADWRGHKSIERRGSTLLIYYWKKLAALSDANPSNFLLLKHPDLYRYVSLVSAEAWVKNDPRTKLWAKLADNIVKEVQGADVEERTSGGPIRSRTLRERDWRGASSSGNGRLRFLEPFDFFDLDAVAQPDDRMYFTVAEGQLWIWPKPSQET